jgi:hypothetical protein
VAGSDRIGLATCRTVLSAIVRPRPDDQGKPGEGRTEAAPHKNSVGAGSTFEGITLKSERDR